MFNERVWKLLADSLWPLLSKGLTVTIPLTLASFTLGLALAMVAAFVQVAKVPVLRRLARFYIWVFRGTPMIVQLFIVFYGLPGLGVYVNSIPAAIIVFSLNTGAYAAETVRAAIESVPVGQFEAGYMVGMNYLQIMGRVVLPQAMRTAFPPLFNTLIGLVKDTSLAANITVVEMFRTAQLIAARTYDVFAMYCEVAVLYLFFCTFLTWVQHVCERKLEAGR
ncbi:MAG: amino acid ABC transporter permease [Clostridia bacterium]|nr:amino acid ABC transporter permease [Clostridia bacterium]